jgi:hypothetical protein
MNNFDDTTTTENTDTTNDKLIFVNGTERLKYFRGKREYERNKSKVGSVIQYLKKLIRF